MTARSVLHRGFRARVVPLLRIPLPLRQFPRHDARMTPKDRGNQHGALDDVAKSIIEQLQQDGRRPYATIAVAVGLSEAAVRQRVQRLLKAGVIQIVAVTDPLQLGFARQAMIGIRVEGDIEAVAEQVEKFPEVDYVVITAGSFDLLVETVCEDDEHLLELLNDRIRAIPTVRSTETFVYLKLRKQTYTWGTR
jgi:Lrp/AsnC family transcriptional regulator, regulator for asnA, asnC and gidA